MWLRREEQDKAENVYKSDGESFSSVMVKICYLHLAAHLRLTPVVCSIVLGNWAISLYGDLKC